MRIRFRYIFVIANSILIAYFGAQIPNEVGNLTDSIMKENMSWEKLISLVFYLVTTNILVAVNWYITQSLSIDYALKVKKRVIDKYFRIDHGVIRYSAGEYRQLFSADIDNLQIFFSSTIPTLVEQCLLGGLATYYIYIIDPYLVITLTIPMLIYFFPTKKSSNIQKESISRLRKSQIKLQEIANSSFENKDEIYQLNNSEFFCRKFAEKQEEWAKNFLRIDITKNILKSFPRTLDALSPALVLFIGGSLAIQNRISTGSLVSVLGYIGYINAPFKNFFSMMIDFQQAVISKKAIDNYLNVREIKDGDVKLDTVEEVAIFQNGKLIKKLLPGDRQLIIGETGSGKTTLLKCLCGYSTNLNVNVTINNVSMSDLDKHYIKEKIALVSQKNMLIPGTIRENIFLDGRGDLSKEEWLFLDKWVRKFEDGIDTKVVRNNINISGGEKQIICIFRALAQGASMLLLDEITASLDSKSSDQINTLLEKRKDLIILEVLHRTENIDGEEKVIHVENNKFKYLEFKRIA